MKPAARTSPLPGAGPIRADAIGLCCVLSAIATDPAAAQSDSNPIVAPPAPTSSDLFKLSGSFSLDYRLRHTSDATDQDLYGVLGADLGDASRQPLAVHVLARAALDLDGNTDHRGGYAFDSLADTYDSRATAQLYEAWLGGVLDGPVASWRLGRFFIDDTPVATYVDGARLESRAAPLAKLKFGVYGGAPTHFYESSEAGDLIVGTFVEGRPWTSGRTRVDYMHVDDRTIFASRDDDLFALSHWQAVGDRVDLFGRYTWLDSDSRDLSLRGNYSDTNGKLHGQLAYYELFHVQRDLTTEFDPFVEIAFDYQPYRQLSANVGRSFGDHFDLAAGADVRRLRDRALEGAFNHDFERFNLEPVLIGLPDDGTTISATGELWIATPERTTTLGCNVDHAFSKEVKAHIGTSYALYKFDLYQDRELDRVRTYYAGVDWRLSTRLRLRADYTFEKDPFDRYHTVRMRASWTF